MKKRGRSGRGDQNYIALVEPHGPTQLQALADSGTHSRTAPIASTAPRVAASVYASLARFGEERGNWERTPGRASSPAPSDAHRMKLSPLPGRTGLICYGSETGNAQEAAEELAQRAERLRFSIRICDLNSASIVGTAPEKISYFRRHSRLLARVDFRQPEAS